MNTLYRLFATVYPGAYRFIVVNVIIYFCTQSVSTFFSKAFFMISLLATFSGMAVSSQAYVKGDNLKVMHVMVLIVGLLSIASFAGILIWEGSSEEYLVVIFGALTYSVFLFVRATLAAEAEFRILTIAGVLTFIVMAPILYIASDAYPLLVILVFSSQMLVILMVGGKRSFGDLSVNYKIIKDVSSYSMSNGLSTGLSFVVPLILIGEYGESSAASIAQVFTLSTLLFFYPMFLSAGFMVDYRRDSTREVLVHKFNQQVLVYILAVIILSVVVGSYFKVDVFDFIWLFIAMQVSQLSLPYSNIHMILGMGAALLKVNYLTIIALIFMVAILFFSYDKGEQRGQILMVLYCFYMFFRYFLTKLSAERIVKI